MHYITQGGITVNRTTTDINYAHGISDIAHKLNRQLGGIFASNFEYPGRYTRFDIAFIQPPLKIEVCKNQVTLSALNVRGEILLTILQPHLVTADYLDVVSISQQHLVTTIKPSMGKFSEEERSKQNSVFTLLRQIVAIFYSQDDSYLGLYGAFGYDLVFQFEALAQQTSVNNDYRDLVAYLPDEIFIVDHKKEIAFRLNYDFTYADYTTMHVVAPAVISDDYVPNSNCPLTSDFAPGEYAKLVEKAKKYFAQGDLFEVVPSQTFSVGLQLTPKEVFSRLIATNPSPYSFMLNLGLNEYLVGASPEMYVRVTNGRVETCPISGTIKRGANALEDAQQILTLLNSDKDKCELTMCTDVDRNDKSRVCIADSVKVIGRRHVELYSRLIHTVDHVEGQLKDGFDAFDAFLSHAWAVTVTGAPKRAAIEFIHQHEKSPRVWYGGAVGYIGFNGNMNTGLTIRTVRINNGIAQIRVGATLLYDSIPEEEEQETQLKAAALLDTVLGKVPQSSPDNIIAQHNKRVLLIDHQDSFVHNLASYFVRLGATVTTLRFDFTIEQLVDFAPHLIVLSPGPGRPVDFNLQRTIDIALANNIPLFGVCLGLQGIVEYFGGKLNVLDYPMHGKAVALDVKDKQDLFANIEDTIEVGLYHSLYADRATLPQNLHITALSVSGIIMAIRHKQLPIWAVQFHPESLLSMHQQHGLRMIDNLLRQI